MKIVCIDNFNRETKSDRLVADNITHDAEAEVMLAALRDRFSSDNSPEWYVLKPDNYRLYKFEY